MQDTKTRDYIKEVLKNMPEDWVNLTTHRLDIYNEKLAKVQFLEQFETLYINETTETSALKVLPTAYDYIRLGHPLSSVLEWGIAKEQSLDAEFVISFQSKTVPILSILRTNLLEGKNTQINYKGTLPADFNADIIFSCNSNEMVTFNNTSSGANSYLWDFGDGFTSNIDLRKDIR